MRTLRQQLDTRLVRLARTMTTREAALDAAYLLTDACAGLPGVVAAGVLQPTGQARGEPLAWTEDQLSDAFYATEADRDLDVDGAVTTYADLVRHADRWPGLARLAGAHRIDTVYAVPVQAFGVAVGTVVLLCRGQRPLSADAVDTVRCCASIAAAGVLADAIADTLPDTAVALTRHGTRQDQISVWQATGMLAARHDVDLATALVMLRNHARDHAQPLVRSARDLLAGAPGAPEVVAAPGTDPRILLLDPDRFTSGCLADVLRADGFQVTAVSSVDAARVPQATPPPVAIIDQIVAGAAEFIRELDTTRVIVISAVVPRSTPPEGSRVLPKPVHPRHVLSVVRDLHPAAAQRAVR